MISVSVAVIEIAGRGDAALAEALAAAPLVLGQVWRKGTGTVPHRRALALEACAEDALLIVEDTVRLAAGWLDAVHDALADSGVGAASGPVRPGPALDPAGRAWALHEYSGWSSPPSRPPDALPGHLLLLRTAAARAAVGSGHPIREDELFAGLSRAGFGLRIVDGLSAQVVATDPSGTRLRGQLQHGRGWAARESARAGWRPLHRVARLAGWPVTAALRSREALGNASSKAVAGRVLALSAAWAIGEGIGAVFGPGSEEHWS